FGAARAGLTGGAVGLRALSNLAFLVFVPALLFRSMAKVDLAQAVPAERVAQAEAARAAPPAPARRQAQAVA
ncbi:hypothetical protein HZU84_07740, partial [Sphaerotilus natans subsp. sulfidivorans]|nr:hypothetical protein [Sphaerotilus sulfidivorans]